MTETAEMQEAEEAAVNVLWMSTRSLERIWGEHRQTGASTYQVANGKFDRFINPLVLKSDFDAMRAQRDEATRNLNEECNRHDLTKKRIAEMQATNSRMAEGWATLHAQITRLREALKPFADACISLDGASDRTGTPRFRDEYEPARGWTTLGQLRVARAALSEPSPSNSGDTP